MNEPAIMLKKYLMKEKNSNYMIILPVLKLNVYCYVLLFLMFNICERVCLFSNLCGAAGLNSNSLQHARMPSETSDFNSFSQAGKKKKSLFIFLISIITHNLIVCQNKR